MKNVRLKKWMLICTGAAAVIEGLLAYNYYGHIEPFPYEDFYYNIINHVLRDLLLCLIGWGLYFRRSRIPDRIKRYFPVVVTGVMYLGIAFLWSIS